MEVSRRARSFSVVVRVVAELVSFGLRVHSVDKDEKGEVTKTRVMGVNYIP